MLPKKRQPIHPGRILKKHFLHPLSQRELAASLGWSYSKLNDILHARRRVDAHSALSLSHCFKMDTAFWMNLQGNWDIWHAERCHIAK